MTAIATRLRNTLALWIETARTRRALAMLDDRMLADIGLTRTQATVEAKRWFWDCTPRRPDDQEADQEADAAVGVAWRNAQILPWPGAGAQPQMSGDQAA